MGKYQKLRVLAIAAFVAFAALLLGGCGDAPKAKADETISVMAKGFMSLDFSDFDRIGIKKEKQEEWKSKVQDKMKDRLKGQVKKSQIKLNDDQLQQMLDKMFASYKKAAVSAKLVSEEGDKAVVELSVQKINHAKMQALMQERMQQKIQGMPQEEVQSKVAGIMIEIFSEAADAIEFMEEPVVMKIKCKVDKDNNIWLPEEGSLKFAARVLTAVDSK